MAPKMKKHKLFEEAQAATWQQRPHALSVKVTRKKIIELMDESPDLV